MVEVNTLKQTINSTFGRSGEFSESFWRFIQEVVGIKYIYKQQNSYLKKPIPFEERKRRIEELLERADYDDDKLSPSDIELTKW